MLSVLQYTTVFQSIIPHTKTRCTFPRGPVSLRDQGTPQEISCQKERQGQPGKLDSKQPSIWLEFGWAIFKDSGVHVTPMNSQDQSLRTYYALVLCGVGAKSKLKGCLMRTVFGPQASSLWHLVCGLGHNVAGSLSPLWNTTLAHQTTWHLVLIGTQEAAAVAGRKGCTQ